ncbi:MAG: anti-FecI sigma factor FecR [Sphingomonas bacterium]|jgi:transmembrane sensor|uniref:FecR family protein n=1 Tax=Sphingomonas bacterium TaxID=1895847 RepID=UPI0026019FCE|nr:FecR domain-containing protein [Sphingomonas bacterium]MDB5702937.1 anti-FecI sigma factor FecR [Sphingomonas bacterium]
MSDTIIDEAARWQAAQDSDAMDWDAFTLWLEADPRHRAAFDSLALLDDKVMAQREQIVALLPTAPEPAEPRRYWRAASLAAGGAIAAAVALAIALPHPGAVPTKLATYRTGAGETREVALRDGSRIELAPSSMMTIENDRQSQLTVAGSAYFDVPHRPGRDLTILAGGLTIHDVGTRFAVDAGVDSARVAVAEGALEISSPRIAKTVKLVSGQNFLASNSLGLMQRGAQRPETVASWRRGELVYDGAPLALVAGDVARYAGKAVTVDPAIANRRFSGVLTIGDGTGLVGTLAAIMALDARPMGNGVRLEPARKP